jgi:hypothetical protein
MKWHSVLFLFLLSPFFLSAQSLRKADKLYELYEFTEAAKEYFEVLDKEPENVQALSRIADCYRMMNKMTEAASWYAKAIRQPGIDPIHLLNYGKVLKALGKYDEAASWFLTYGEAFPVIGNHFAESCYYAKSVSGQPTPFDIREEYINSVFSDFGPAFYKGNVVFASARTDVPRTGKRDKVKLEEGKENQLFQSGTLDNGFLDKPLFYHSEVAHSKNEGPVSFSKDGRWVAFTRNNFQEGKRPIQGSGLQLSIYIASVDARGNWGEPKAFPYNGSDYSTGFPCLADNGQTLYFASDRPESYGGFDLFVSRRVGDDWTPPVNMGNTLNTPGNEVSPFFDGNTLYFSSDWHLGLGGMDLFTAESSGGVWAGVQNMGDGMNSPYDDFGLIYDQPNNRGYFVSNRPGGKGKEDLYQFSKKTDYVEIVVIDGSTRAPIPEAIVDFSACGEPVYKTDVRGRYVFRAFSGLDCSVAIKKAGYTSYMLDITTLGNNDRKEYEIFLIKSSERFIGRVVNAVNNRALAEVLVFATNQDTGNKVETTTNPAGEYMIPLSPGANYLIRYSKAGYLDVMKNIRIDNVADKTALGSVPLQPSGTVLPDEKKEEKEPGTGIDDSEFIIDDGSESDPSTLKEGFAVQVAAIFKEEEMVDLGKYQTLRSVGNVYSKPEGKAVKVRIGIYPSREQAEKARQEIAKKGYGRAFVVKESVDSRMEKILLATSTADDFSEKRPDSASSQSGNYKVQLAAYSDPSNFNSRKVEGLGMIEERKKGNLTIMLLSGFQSLNEARQAQSEARRAGFSGAYVVLEKNGSLIPLRN